MSEYNVSIGALTEEDRGTWNSCVSQCEHGSFFHRYEWLKAIETGLSLEPRHVVVRKGPTIVGGLPQFIAPVRGAPLYELRSTPMGYGGPILVGDRPKVLALVLSNARRSASGRRLLFHRITTAQLGYAQYGAYLEDQGYMPDLRACRFVLDLRNPLEEVRRSFSSTRRQEVRRAEREDRFFIQDCELRDGLKVFYPLYAETMARVGGRQRPRAFFDVLATLVGGDEVRVFTCESDDETITAFMQMVDRDRKAIHHFFSGTSEAVRGTVANQALHLHTIRWGKDQGIQFYDLGQTKADPTDRLHIWKKQWGGQVEPCMAWRRPLSRSLAYAYEGARRWRGWLLRRLR